MNEHQLLMCSCGIRADKLINLGDLNVVGEYFYHHSCPNCSMVSVCKICLKRTPNSGSGMKAIYEKTAHAITHYMSEEVTISQTNICGVFYDKHIFSLDVIAMKYPSFYFLKSEGVLHSPTEQEYYDRKNSDLLDEGDLNFEYADELLTMLTNSQWSCIICGIIYDCFPTNDGILAHIDKSHPEIDEGIKYNVTFGYNCDCMGMAHRCHNSRYETCSQIVGIAAYQLRSRKTTGIRALIPIRELLAGKY